MSKGRAECTSQLPFRIARAEYEDPTLMIGGAGWSLSATCPWRWINSDGRLVSDGTLGSADAVWDLVGDTITEVTWIEEPKLGADPWFHLASGGRLELFSDAAFDTWVMQLSGLASSGRFSRRQTTLMTAAHLLHDIAPAVDRLGDTPRS